jgi:hypothetical protein
MITCLLNAWRPNAGKSGTPDQTIDATAKSRRREDRREEIILDEGILRFRDDLERLHIY